MPLTPHRPGRRRPRRAARPRRRDRVGDGPEAVARRGLPRAHRPRHPRGPRDGADDPRPADGGLPMSTTTSHGPCTTSARPGRPWPTPSRQTMTLAWRATMKMRRSIEVMFDVTIQPLVFTAMFAYIFGGAISGDVDELPAADHPRPDRADRADGVRGDRRPARARTSTRASSTGSRCCRSRASHRWPARWSADMLRYFIAAVADLRRRHRHRLPPGRWRPRRRRGRAPGRAGRAGRWPGSSRCFGIVGRNAQGVQAHLPAGDVPADVPVQRVRPDRHDARAAPRRSPSINPVSLVITALRDLANDGARSPRASAGRCSGAPWWSRSSPRCRCAAFNRRM